MTQLSQVARYNPGWAESLTQPSWPSCLAKPSPCRHICDETWNNNTSQLPTSSSLLLCSFCCSMRFCRSASSCFLYFSWSFSCCCCQWGSERFLFSCCSLRNSRRRVDSPGRLTMELKQRGGFKWQNIVLKREYEVLWEYLLLCISKSWYISSSWLYSHTWCATNQPEADYWVLHLRVSPLLQGN